MELLYVILFVCYASYAYNRKSVVLSMPMLKQTGLDASVAGLIVSCQNIAFSIGKFLAGILSDRLNPYLLFATGLLITGLTTVAFSYSSSALVFCCLWFLNGLAQGCGWPSCAKILRETASPTQFGTLWSFLSSSNNFSGSVGPLIAAFITVHYGWEWNVFTAGLLTLLLCGLFLLSLPFMTNAANKKIQERKSPSSPLKKDEAATMVDLFFDPFIWMLSVSSMVVFCARTTTTDWGQMYLMEEKKHGQLVASAFTSSVETGGFVGRIAAGYLTDWVIKRNCCESKQGISSRSKSRISVAVIFLVGSVASLHLFLFAVSEASSMTWITCIGAVMGMSYYGPIAVFGIVASESVPSHLSGSSNAIVALFSNRMEVLYVILFICYSSYAFNRKSVVFSMPSLKEEGLDPSHAGLITSCQNIAFAVGEFLAGVLSDSLNPQQLFSTGLLISGTATILFSYSSTVTAFCSLWFLNGLAQGCGWPSCAKILRQRAPPSQFGTLWSILSASNNFAGSLGPIISAFILVHYGWRWNVFNAGAVTLLLCGFFILSLFFLSDVKNPNSPEKKETSPGKKSEETSLKDLFLDPCIWMLSISLMVVFCARTTTLDWGQMYLMEENDHSQYVASAFTSSVETGGFIGRILAGYLTDLVIRRNINSAKQGSPSKSVLRMYVALIFVVGSVVSLHLFRFAVSESSSTVWIMSVGAAMGMSYYGPISIFGIISSESVPSHLSGSSYAILSLFGNIGATMSGLPMNYIAKYYEWSTVFFMLEILIGGTLLILARNRNLMPKIRKLKAK